MSTKKWTKPQLIVLAKGTPAETLEPLCKIIDGLAGIGPNDIIQDGCNRGQPGDCGACQGRSGGIS